MATWQEESRFALECLGEGDRTQHRAKEVVSSRSEALARILEALQRRAEDPNAEKGDRYDEYKAAAWKSFYNTSPTECAFLIVKAVRYLTQFGTT